MSGKIALLDYGMGNLHSIKKVFSRLGSEVKVTADPSVISSCDKLVLPGVGHFGKAMQNLRERSLTDILHELALVKQVPILGICLGMQLMANSSEEGGAQGLGWIDADVSKFKIEDSALFKIPHMGWNTLLSARPDDHILTGINERDEFYFVHSYHMRINNESQVLARTQYAYSFVSAVRHENLIGMQFHPEKSHFSGERLIKNFLSL